MTDRRLDFIDAQQRMLDRYGVEAQSLFIKECNSCRQGVARMETGAIRDGCPEAPDL